MKGGESGWNLLAKANIASKSEGRKIGRNSVSFGAGFLCYCKVIALQ